MLFMPRRALLLSLPLLFAAPAYAADPAPVSALVAKVDIPYQQFTLPNGLRVVVHTDRKAPVVAVSVWYHIGSKDEPKGKTGFAHLFEHLMFNGSENAPEDIFKPLQQIGATDTNGTTWYDRTNYFETVPTGALETALFLESDRMGYLLGGVTQQKLDTQRGVVQNEKRQGDNEPFGTTGYVENANLFPVGHPYRHTTIGSMADLNGASLEDVKTWFRANYGASNAVVVLAGDIDLPTAKRLMTKWFGKIARGPAVARIAAPIPTLPAPKSVVIKDRVPYTRIARHWVVEGVNGQDTTALEVAAAVLGGLSSSRLENALVRGEQLAIGVSAGVQQQEKVGFFEISANVKPGQDPAKVAARLDAIIADFIKMGPSEDEVRRVATKSLAGTIGGYESVGGFGGKAVALAEGLVYSGDPGKYKKDLKALAAVTPASVKAAMQKWLTRPVLNVTVEPGERPTAACCDHSRRARRPNAHRTAGRHARGAEISGDRTRDADERDQGLFRAPSRSSGRPRLGQLRRRLGRRSSRQAGNPDADDVAARRRHHDEEFDADRRGTGTAWRYDLVGGRCGSQQRRALRADAKPARLARSACRCRAQSCI
jgi:zinc protease